MSSRFMVGLAAVVIVVLSLQLHAMPAAAAPADVRCWNVPSVQPPKVVAVDGTIRVDNRCNHQGALVVVWEPYQVSAETFYAKPGRVTVNPTLHSGQLRVWVIYDYGAVFYLFRKQMR